MHGAHFCGAFLLYKTAFFYREKNCLKIHIKSIIIYIIREEITLVLFQTMEIDEKRKKIEIDEAIFPKIAKGDKVAFTVLYQLTDKVIYAYILSILKNTEDAKDVMQETYLKILSAAHLYHPQGKPLAWMFTIAKNLSLMHIRKNVKHVEFEPSAFENRQELSYMDQTEERLVLEAALNVLSEREHQMLLLHTMAGWKHREIAAYMGLSLANTIKTYNRALKKVKKYLEK